MDPGAEISALDGDVDEDGVLHLIAGADGDRDLVVACGRVCANYGRGSGLFDRLDEPLVIDFGDSDRMGVTFAGLLDEQRVPSPGGALMTRALMKQCMVLIFRELCEDRESALPWLSALDDPDLARALDEIMDHPDHRLTLQALADLALMSRSSFSVKLRAAFGTTPMAFVHNVRMNRAAELLASGSMSVDQVAGRVGFSSRSHFSRSFQESHGASPTDYRAGRRRVDAPVVADSLTQR